LLLPAEGVQLLLLMPLETAILLRLIGGELLEVASLFLR
jgi:hypothetical protein